MIIVTIASDDPGTPAFIAQVQLDDDDVAAILRHQRGRRYAETSKRIFAAVRDVARTQR